jgi:glycosyltransferase involved in cell wall biosynthesis
MLSADRKKGAMKILLTNHFPLMGSGSGVYAANVARELSEAGHEVAALYPDTSRPESGEYPFRTEVIRCPAPGESAGARLDLSFPFPCFTTHPRSNRTFYSLSDPELAEYLAVVEQRIKAVMASFAADVIHAQHIWVSAAMAVRTGRPCVITCHGTDLLGYRAAPSLRHLAHESADGAREIVAVSAATASEVRQLFGLPERRLATFPSGVDGRTFRPIPVDRSGPFRELGLPVPAGPVVVYAGKLACFKGPDTLVEAAAIYERQLPGVTTVLVGDGSERPTIERLARALHLRNLHFAGFVGQDALARLYSAADLAVVPSREEPFGLAAIEAMACGKPVVASRVGGLPEHVDDTVGRLVNPDSPGELAQAICDELHSPERPAKARAAAARGTEYTWTKHTDRLLEIYSKARGN